MCFSLPNESDFSCHLKVTGIISKAVGQVYEGKHIDWLMCGLLWGRQMFPGDRGLRATGTNPSHAHRPAVAARDLARTESSQSANGVNGASNTPWGLQESCCLQPAAHGAWGGLWFVHVHKTPTAWLCLPVSLCPGFQSPHREPSPAPVVTCSVTDAAVLDTGMTIQIPLRNAGCSPPAARSVTLRPLSSVTSTVDSCLAEVLAPSLAAPWYSREIKALPAPCNPGSYEGPQSGGLGWGSITAQLLPLPSSAPFPPFPSMDGDPPDHTRVNLLYVFFRGEKWGLERPWLSQNQISWSL